MTQEPPEEEKLQPGKKFDWGRLVKENFSLGIETGAVQDARHAEQENLAERLREWGSSVLLSFPFGCFHVLSGYIYICYHTYMYIYI